MRGWGVGALLTAVAGALVVIGVASGGDRPAARDDATPPAIVVNGVAVGPGGYDWSSSGIGTFRRMPVEERPHRPGDFVAVLPAQDGTLTIRLDGFDPASRVEVAFFAEVGADGQPLTACAGDGWRGSADGGPVRVPVPDGAGFVAVTVAESVPDLPSALPEDRTARYGARLSGGDDGRPAVPRPDRGGA
jgi:hypothetical protein